MPSEFIDFGLASRGFQGEWQTGQFSQAYRSGYRRASSERHQGNIEDSGLSARIDVELSPQDSVDMLRGWFNEMRSASHYQGSGTNGALKTGAGAVAAAFIETKDGVAHAGAGDNLVVAVGEDGRTFVLNKLQLADRPEFIDYIQKNHPNIIDPANPGTILPAHRQTVLNAIVPGSHPRGISDDIRFTSSAEIKARVGSNYRLMTVSDGAYGKLSDPRDIEDHLTRTIRENGINPMEPDVAVRLGDAIERSGVYAKKPDDLLVIASERPKPGSSNINMNLDGMGGHGDGDAVSHTAARLVRDDLARRGLIAEPHRVPPAARGSGDPAQARIPSRSVPSAAAAVAAADAPNLQWHVSLNETATGVPLRMEASSEHLSDQQFQDLERQVARSGGTLEGYRDQHGNRRVAIQGDVAVGRLAGVLGPISYDGNAAFALDENARRYGNRSLPAQAVQAAARAWEAERSAPISPETRIKVDKNVSVADRGSHSIVRVEIAADQLGKDTVSRLEQAAPRNGAVITGAAHIEGGRRYITITGYPGDVHNSLTQSGIDPGERIRTAVTTSSLSGRPLQKPTPDTETSARRSSGAAVSSFGVAALEPHVNQAWDTAKSWVGGAIDSAKNYAGFGNTTSHANGASVGVTSSGTNSPALAGQTIPTSNGSTAGTPGAPALAGQTVPTPNGATSGTPGAPALAGQTVPTPNGATSGTPGAPALVGQTVPTPNGATSGTPGALALPGQTVATPNGATSGTAGQTVPPSSVASHQAKVDASPVNMASQTEVAAAHASTPSGTVLKAGGVVGVMMSGVGLSHLDKLGEGEKAAMVTATGVGFAGMATDGSMGASVQRAALGSAQSVMGSAGLNFARILGPAAIVIMAIPSVFSGASDIVDGKIVEGAGKVGQGFGMFSATVAGMTYGAMAGTALGPVGTLVGGALGGFVGAVAGTEVGRHIGEAIGNLASGQLVEAGKSLGNAVIGTVTGIGSAAMAIGNGAVTLVTDPIGTAAAIGNGLANAGSYIVSGTGSAISAVGSWLGFSSETKPVEGPQPASMRAEAERAPSSDNGDPGYAQRMDVARAQAMNAGMGPYSQRLESSKVDEIAMQGTPANKTQKAAGPALA